MSPLLDMNLTFPFTLALDNMTTTKPKPLIQISVNENNHRDAGAHVLNGPSASLGIPTTSGGS